jgi:hypothetical protein
VVGFLSALVTWVLLSNGGMFMNAADQKLKDIENVQQRYIGGFISENHAIADMNDILRSKYAETDNLVAVNLETGQTMNLGSAVIRYRAKQN